MFKRRAHCCISKFMILLLLVFRSGHEGRRQVRWQVCVCVCARLRQDRRQQDCLLYITLVLFSFFLVHFLWPCWTPWTWRGARKQWNLLPFQRPALTCSLKSVEKYRLLCFVCCRHSQQWPAEYSNHDAISQSRTTLADSTTDLKLCRNTWTVRVCVHVCPNHTNYQHNGGLIKLPAQKFSSIELLPLIWPLNSLESILSLFQSFQFRWWHTLMLFGENMTSQGQRVVPLLKPQRKRLKLSDREFN